MNDLNRLVDSTALLDLAKTARIQYEAHRGEKWLVDPAVPVLFFGNLCRYEASCPRIATVGLNPSHHEFPPNEPFMRFPNADTADAAAYLAILSSYFQNRPYHEWFDSYEKALHGMGTTYYGEEKNTAALHTDIGAVLPTEPTWSKLGNPIRNRLIREGAPLWRRLIDSLQPDILLSSIAWQWMNERYIKLEPHGSWEVIHTFEKKKDCSPRKRPVRIKARWHALPAGDQVLFAHVPAAQTPLGLLSNEQKRLAGRRILAHWHKMMKEHCRCGEG